VDEPAQTPLLLDPAALVELGERERWHPRELDLSGDAASWAGVPRGLQERLLWHIEMFFVGEERVTTELGALIRASESPAEAEFLAMQQLDEARHTEHFDRFYRDVAGQPGGLREHVAVARERLAPPLVALLETRLSAAAERLARAPRDPVAKVEFVTIYHMVIEGTLALTGQRLLLDVLEERDLLPGWREGLRRIARDEHRHIAYGAWLLREKAADPALRERICALLDELAPLVADVLVPPGARPERFAPLGRSGVELRGFAFAALERRMRVIGVRSPVTLGG
jgi:ribonucleoside-diphosphate reductase beta chain